MPPISHRELKDLNAIGQGGFGVVYRAQHARLGTVVYKELNAQILGDRYLKFVCDCLSKFSNPTNHTIHIYQTNLFN